MVGHATGAVIVFEELQLTDDEEDEGVATSFALFFGRGTGGADSERDGADCGG